MSKLTDLLNDCVAGTYALMALTHCAHWNVEGRDFFPLHDAFGEQYQALLGAADKLAERVRQLGSYAMPRMAPLASKLQELPKLEDSGRLVPAIIAGNETAIVALTAAKDESTRVNDLETQNLLIDLISDHQKVVWKLKSHLVG